MGLDCSHDAFSGAYSAFNRFRQMIAEATGGSFPPHYVYDQRGSPETIDGTGDIHSPLKYKVGLNEDYAYFGDDMPEALRVLLLHSDCDGEMSPHECTAVADALESILPKIRALNWTAVGHIEARGGYEAVTVRFIEGCRRAAAANEPLEFH